MGASPLLFFTNSSKLIIAFSSCSSFFPSSLSSFFISWFGFAISIKNQSSINRNNVIRYIENHNIQTRLLFSGNLIKHPCFDQIRGTDAYRVEGNLDATEFVMNNSFWVGVYPGMTDEMIDYMAEVIICAVSKEHK